MSSLHLGQYVATQSLIFTLFMGDSGVMLPLFDIIGLPVLFFCVFCLTRTNRRLWLGSILTILLCGILGFGDFSSVIDVPTILFVCLGIPPLRISLVSLQEGLNPHSYEPSKGRFVKDQLAVHTITVVLGIPEGARGPGALGARARSAGRGDGVGIGGAEGLDFLDGGAFSAARNCA